MCAMREVNPSSILCFLDVLEAVRPKVFEGRKGNGDGLITHVKESLEEIQNVLDKSLRGK